MKRHASLNRIYRLVWNQALSAWVAVAECARGRGKSSARRKLVANVAAATAALALAFSLQARAGPTDGQMVAGSGAISQAGNTTTVHQSSQNLAINWTDFSVAAHEAVRFNQPNATSIVLNRVLGQSISQIHGAISANGQVFILNPNGILFGAGAQVNVGGLVASTLSLSNDDFMANRFSFSNNGESGSIINQGTLTAAQSGYIAMLAPQVINEGVISATLGSAVMAAGNQVTLNLSRGSLVGFSIDKGAFQALVDNKQLIEADGGQVFMSAKAAEAITKAMVNNSGIVEARTLANVNGRIELISDMAQGTTNVGGILDASAPNGGDGGFIETSGARVKVANDARITTAAPSGNTGSWLIDPYDFTVAATGGDITGEQLSDALNLNDITIQTAVSPIGDYLNNREGANGDIFINDAVSWAAPTILTLDAFRNIEINKTITSTDAEGVLALKFGQGASNGEIDGTAASYSINAPVNLRAGENFSTQLGSDGAVKEYYVITDLGAEGSDTTRDLQGIKANLGGHYALGANIDATFTNAWNSDSADPESFAGFQPLGDSNTPFTGNFEGLGHTISNLTINRPISETVGLIGRSEHNTISNVRLSNADITGGYSVGALVGGLSYGLVHNSSASGAVRGVTKVGGLVGANYVGSISDSHATANVVSVTNVNESNYGGAATGGLVGINFGRITGSYASGNVTSTVHLSYDATGGNASGVNKVGGLAGVHVGEILDSHASGSVTGNFNLTFSIAADVGTFEGANKVGGLVGSGFNGFGFLGTISSSYASGTVKGNTAIINNGAVDTLIVRADVGGLVGSLDGNGSIDGNGSLIADSHASGSVGQAVSFNNESVYTNQQNISSASGGLVGRMANDSSVFNSEATGPVSIGDHNFGAEFIVAGGLVGFNEYGSIVKSHASGNVSSRSPVGDFGGLVGHNEGIVSQSYASGDVTVAQSSYGDARLGGLVGWNNGIISQSYSTGNLIASELAIVGGLVGRNYGDINNSYATGLVKGEGKVGGLVGVNNGLVDSSFWDISTTQQFDAIGMDNGPSPSENLIGLSTADFLNQASFTGWDFTVDTVDLNNTGTWFMINGETRPFLQSEYSTNITNSHQLQLMAMDLTANYTLANNIDMSAEFSNVSGMWATDTNASIGKGFVPVGTYGENNQFSGENNQFSGSLDGQNHTISGLSINRSDWSDVGLFGRIGATASISDVGLLKVAIAGGYGVGGLVGYNYGQISNSYVTGSVAGDDNVGGLVGFNDYGSISNSYAAVNVTGTGDDVGGLVGDSEGGTFVNVYAAGNVSGIASVGGLIGENENGIIINSYSTGNVRGTDYGAGGLVGYNYDGSTITNSYATGQVLGNENVGGLVGYNYEGMSISNSYAIGNVAGNSGVGGLVGYNENTDIANSYATGAVAGNDDVGGLVGINEGGTVRASFWDTNTSGQLRSAGGIGQTTAQLLDPGAYDDWDFSAGTGTWFMINGETRPFLQSEYNTRITNSHQLQLMAMNLTADYTLANNIDMGSEFNNVSGMWATDREANTPIGRGFMPLGGSEANRFVGSFDGQNNSISGLVISRPALDGVGLFAYGEGPISNVNLIGVSITGSDYVGGLAGNNYGIISNSSVTGMVSGSRSVGGLVGWTANGSLIDRSYSEAIVYGSRDNVGGLVGENRGSVSNSYASGNVDGDDNVGALVGNNYGTIRNSYAIGAAAGDIGVGGLVGDNRGNISVSYATGLINGTSLVGGLVGSNDGVVENSFWDTVTTQQNYAIGHNNGDAANLVGLNTTNFLIQANFNSATSANGNNTMIDWDFSAGSGTWFMIEGETRPFLQSEYSTTITNAHQLQLMAMDVTANYTLANNIDMSAEFNNVSGMWATNTAAEAGRGFVPIGNENDSFTGSFDGQNHTISGLTISRLDWEDEVGLFGIASANISNIGLLGVDITGSVGSYGVGALVGYNYGHISNSFVSGSVEGDSNVGGLVGFNDHGNISDSYTDANVTGSGDDVGGLVGDSEGGYFSHTFATGNVSGSASVGGLIGENENGLISNSYATGSVTGTNYGTGGLVGYNYGNSSISKSYSTGNVTGADYGAGGLVGKNENSTISNSYASGNVGGENNVGGLVGYNYGSIINSYATGNVTGDNEVGGLVGYNEDSTVSNSYATGNVIGINKVGGLVGVNDGIINISYATGFVTGDGYLGGLVADNTGTISNSFWDTETTGMTDGYGIGNNNGFLADGTPQAGVIGLSTQAFLNEANFTSATSDNGNTNAEWNFTSGTGTWFMIEGETRPFLQSEYSTRITNSHQLQLMAMDVTANYSLSKNIDMSGEFNNVSGMWVTDIGAADPIGKGFMPVGQQNNTFTGTFDGQNNTISGLTINRPTMDGVGLFGQAEGGVRNVGLLNVAIVGRNDVGGLVGQNKLGNISNSYVTGNVSGWNSVGGLVGRNQYGNISNNYATGTVLGSNKVGGLVGSTKNGNISSSYATGNVEGQHKVGGLVGENTSEISIYDYSSDYAYSAANIWNSYATGDVSASGNNVGGLVGLNQSILSANNEGTITNARSTASIENSYATGDVNGSAKVGGLVGLSESLIQTNQGYVVDSISSVLISSSYAMGNVSGNYQIGGLVGNSNGSAGITDPANVTNSTSNATIIDSYASGNARSGLDGAPSAGGLVGANYGLIENSYAMGNVSGVSYIGGLVGFGGGGSIVNSYATGQAIGEAQYVGGLLGYNNEDSSINNSYAIGNAEGDQYVGGLVGYNEGTIANSYAAGGVIGNTDIGGLVGGRNEFAQATESYWDTTASGQLVSAGGTGMTGTQMKQLASFSAWGADINNTGAIGAVWRIYDGYSMPLLTSFMQSMILNDTVLTYNGREQIGEMLDSNGSRRGTAASGTNVGSYIAYSNQQGYNIIGGMLTINPANESAMGPETFLYAIGAGLNSLAKPVASNSEVNAGDGCAADVPLALPDACVANNLVKDRVKLPEDRLTSLRVSAKD